MSNAGLRSGSQTGLKAGVSGVVALRGDQQVANMWVRCHDSKHVFPILLADGLALASTILVCKPHEFLSYVFGPCLYIAFGRTIPVLYQFHQLLLAFCKWLLLYFGRHLESTDSMFYFYSPASPCRKEKIELVCRDYGGFCIARAFGFLGARLNQPNLIPMQLQHKRAPTISRKRFHKFNHA